MGPDPPAPPESGAGTLLLDLHTWLTHLADPAEAEVALQDEVKFLLDAEGGDVTAEPQAVSDGAVLGMGRMGLKAEDSIELYDLRGAATSELRRAVQQTPI